MMVQITFKWVVPCNRSRRPSKEYSFRCKKLDDQPTYKKDINNNKTMIQ